ncbi:MAG TPA: hypothetical protein VLA32_09165 [Anaerolineales bacterium]|jgi:predicted membrane channel-forming protein YqfA (hemolysin III family)|nr:hypothetical protein [Anaerolineales bacterium]
MWTPDEILRIMLFACLFGMVMVAIFYLRQRKLTTLAYLLWGLFAVVVPVLGPYLVIISRPGEPDR